MARETNVYEMALQQTVVVTVRASDHLPEIYSTELTAAVAGVALEMRTAWPALSTTV